jgi:acetoacetyl-CoA synthetase
MSSILWQPTAQQIASANVTRFIAQLRCQGVPLPDASYDELHCYSIAQAGEFWRALWRFCEVRGSLGPVALTPGPHMTQARWFPDSTLNFAENLLRPGESTDAPALIACNEAGDERVISRRQLLDQSLALAAFLRGCGVEPGHRVAAVLPNIPEAVVAMLGSAAIGAIWSSCSPDFGADAICDRFSQIEPVVLIISASGRYSGKTIPLLEQLRPLLDRLPSVKAVVVVGGRGLPASTSSCRWLHWDDCLAGPAHAEGFSQLPFDHPLYILYSSGTTGAPKCIVHGAGGTLLQHLKEHSLHVDVRPGDRMLFFTSTGWMMWNWLVSVLASRATAVLYDGSPLHPRQDILLELTDRHGVTHLGSGAKYFAALEKLELSPRDNFKLDALRCVMSTGSPLLPRSFDYIYEHIKADVQLASISGGTDIVSCFVLGCPILPVRRGEIQCKGLGMDVQIWDERGRRVIGQPGELVCASPFPSMPVRFWNDPDRRKYLGSYFGVYDNVWRHGDWATETPHGGIVIEGRSDATLNPGGIRIGTAEIYQQVEAIPGIAECLATAYRQDGDEQIVLFVRMQDGVALDDRLVKQIKTRLRERCSPRHVPAHVVAAPQFPRTINGKPSEVAVRQAIHGQAIANVAALENPQSLEFFRHLPAFAGPRRA